MCGIVGVILRDSAAVADEARLVAARDSLTHRGPDEAGLWMRPGVGLAHRRLRVLDLTNGQQPMVDGDDRFALVYNGEIYNFRELQGDYRNRGVEFKTRCDTELVFQALNRDGSGALQHFNGMFAIGHWDNQKRQLLLVRDRLGQKPLYWYADDNLFVFASELKAVLEYLQRRFELDPTAIDQFFCRGYILSPRTIFRNIHKLPAGHLLRLSAGPGQWTIQTDSYWDHQPHETPTSPTEAVDALDELLTDAVSLRLVSDVPIGCLLSGGIDSSLITALATKVSDQPVCAFSIGFDESDQLNELPYAEMVARHLGCDWRKRLVGGDDFIETLEETAGYFDEPFANFAMFPTRLLARMAREELVVVLSGQGGDELSAGYPGRYNWVCETEAAAATRSQYCQYAPPVDDLIQHLAHTSFLPFAGGRDVMFSKDLIKRITAEATPFDSYRGCWDRPDVASRGRLDRVLYTDVKTNLPDYLICIEERMTMSCGLESRNPMLDWRVVDFMLSLPTSMKIRDGRNKWILQELAARYVPRAAIDRPKRGFTPPLDLWVNQNEAPLRDLIASVDPIVGGLYSPDWRKLLLAGAYGQVPLMAVFYSLMFAVWARRYGQFIADGMSDGGAGTVSADSPWQTTLRKQLPEDVGLARWFCQAMANFEPGDAVQLEGDQDGWYAYLASECGLSVVGGESTVEPAPAASRAEEQDSSNASVGTIVLGVDQLRHRLAESTDPWRGEAGATVLLFLPFQLSDQATIEGLLRDVASRIPIRGGQAVQLGPERGVYIARAEVAAVDAVPA